MEDESRTFEDFVEVLQSDEPKDRRRATHWLKDTFTNDPRLFDLWLSALEDDDGEVRVNAAQALDGYDDIRVFEPLCSKLQDEYDAVRVYAAKALAKFGERAVEPLLAALAQEEEGALEEIRPVLINYPHLTLAPLMDALNDPETNRRYGAAFCLSEFNDPSIVDPLVKVAANRNESGYIRQVAAEGLGNFNDKLLTTFLIELLKDKTDDNFARGGAAAALIKIENEQVMQPLLEALDDESEDIRFKAVPILKRLRVKDAETIAVKMLNDLNNYVRWAVIEVINHFKDRHFIEPILQHLQKEDDFHNFHRAVLFLCGLEDKELVKPLVEIIGYQSPNWSGIERVIILHFKKLGVEDLAVSHLINLLEHKSLSWRINTAQALVIMGYSQYETVLEEMKKQRGYIRGRTYTILF